MTRMGMCRHFGCNHFAQGAFCERHTPAPVVMSAEYEAVRIDPTTDLQEVIHDLSVRAAQPEPKAPTASVIAVHPNQGELL